MLTQKVTGPVGPLIPRIYWSCQNFTGSTNFSSKCQLFTKFFFDITRKKTLHKILQQHLFLFILSSFISRINFFYSCTNVMHKKYLNALFSMLFNVYHNSIRHLMCLMSQKIMYKIVKVGLESVKKMAALPLD